jgi:formylglycine-generating enzyme required for sulfatase activity
MRVSALLAPLVLASSLAAPASGAPAEPRSPFRDCADCPEMVVVPAGTFIMGTVAQRSGESVGRAERDPVVVRIARPFALGRFELTRREYRAFVRDTGYEAGLGCRGWSEEAERFEYDRTRSWEKPGRPREPKDDHPVNCVSFTDAKAYVAWLAKKTGHAYRLPSEAEWEYAARAGSASRFPWGDGGDDGCEFANLYDGGAHERFPFGADFARCQDGFAELAPVGALRPNAFGLSDMIGNVAEWLEDCLTDSYLGRPRDGRAWVWNGGCQRHVVRGGSWLSPPAQARSAFRSSGEMAERGDDLGFRVALDLDVR